jgi:regulator of replication initiation timing
LTTTAKIFIILVCLFAFIFTPLAIGFITQSNNWKDLATSFRDQAENEAAYARSIEAIRTSEFAKAAAQQHQSQQELAEARRQIDQLNQQIADLTGKRNALVLDNEKLKTANELQTGTMNVIATHHDKMAKANDDLRARELDLQTRNAQLLDRNKELTADTVVLKQQLNQRIQEVQVAREENETLRKQLGLGRAGEFVAGGAVTPTAKPETSGGPRAPIRGQVKAVQGNLATIDVGSSSGVKPGMVMVVTRGSGQKASWVCDLAVTSEVNPTEAVGEVRRGGDQQIRPGDVVQDEVTFNAMARS